MKRSYNVLMTVAVAGLLGACSSTPDRIEDLEVARAIVPQVEASPRAGVAATNVSEARKSLDRANAMADKGGKLADIEYEAQIAARNAQIANEKILAAQAREEIEKGEAERQAVLAQARDAEARRNAAAAQSAQQQAQMAQQRATTLEQELSELRAKKTDRGMVLTLGDVLFDTGLATLKPGAYLTIDRLADVLKEAPDRKVMIEGHTDSVGTDEYNQGLSERRAAAVQTALLERGVRSEQITALGKGESVPVASNDNAAGRQQNRRVEMIFTDNQSQVASDVE
ncbi:OmpA family protein [Steroidobacter sp. S1-65]|uniref:OmpA family protein n=1 Tax=Steroidobacter gossypii TaxID=2805490 RepID=A0ABS1WTL7_9GAMM|nr:OmpA family protein [Steroidobacter gossypii]MBM0104282.1 OmpA family protein [Steroidobacter gossypii]